jgi:uncharacterized protein (TIRG00374 family)
MCSRKDPVGTTGAEPQPAEPEHSTPPAARTGLLSLLKNKKVRGILQVMLSAVVLAVLIYTIGLSDVVNTLAGIAWAWYIPAAMLFILSIFLRAHRWYILLGALNRRASFLHLAYLYFLGFFFNNFIPSGFGGDVAKVISLRQEHGRGAEALSSVVMDRVTGLLGSSLVALAALAWNELRPWLWTEPTTHVSLPPALLYITAAISVGVPLGFALFRWTDPLKLLAARLPFTRRVATNDRLQRLVQTVRRYPPSILLRALLVSLPFTLNLVLIQYCIARALSVDVPFSVFPLFVPIISIINLLPISFNGLGTREGVYVFLFVPIGVPEASAFAMSMAFTFLRMTAGLAGGLLYALRSARGIASAPS